jgi:hypothetical protein
MKVMTHNWNNWNRESATRKLELNCIRKLISRLDISNLRVNNGTANTTGRPCRAKESKQMAQSRGGQGNVMVIEMIMEGKIAPPWTIDKL